MNKIVIYTCITGDYEIPIDDFNKKDGYDYVLFSDKPINTISWTNIVLNFTSSKINLFYYFFYIY